MKVSLEIEIECESWFENEPKTKEKWEDYFTEYFLPQNSIIGKEDELVALQTITLKILNIKND